MSSFLNDRFSHIAIRVHRDGHVLLELCPVASHLDAGQWRLPLRPVTDGSMARPNPKCCGLPLSAVSICSDWLEQHQLSWEKVVKVTAGKPQHSPDGHIQKLHILPIDLELAIDPAIADDNAEAWRQIEQWSNNWKTGELLLNPFSQLLMTHSEADWSDQCREQAIFGLTILPTRSNTLPPASHTNTLLLGDRGKWLVDPAPATAEVMQTLINRVEAIERPLGIFLTHHHLDHHQRANDLARIWDIPIRCSADTAARIPKRFSKDYFQGCELMTIEDGETLCQWRGEAVVAHAIPGHDAGHLALQPESRRWMLVGDLIQGIGTVVIAEPEGDMQAYFDTLRWVIEQNPKAIIPSHGQVMGSTYRIAQTLAHRQLREQQILDMHKSGHELSDIVKTLYANVDSRLWPLAAMNVRSHLKKLQNDGLTRP